MFFDQLKQVCQMKKVSLCAVALAAGMSKSNVTNWKSGQTPTLDSINKLAAVLKVSPKDLIPDESNSST